MRRSVKRQRICSSFLFYKIKFSITKEKDVSTQFEVGMLGSLSIIRTTESFMVLYHFNQIFIWVPFKFQFSYKDLRNLEIRNSMFKLFPNELSRYSEQYCKTCYQQISIWFWKSVSDLLKVILDKQLKQRGLPALKHREHRQLPTETTEMWGCCQGREEE